MVAMIFLFAKVRKEYKFTVYLANIEQKYQDQLHYDELQLQMKQEVSKEF